MFIRDTLTIFSIIFLLIVGCSNKDSDPTQIENPPTQIENSARRGLAYDLINPADLDTLKSGVFWWYNWHFSTSAPPDYYADYQMEFIPMLCVKKDLSGFYFR